MTPAQEALHAAEHVLLDFDGPVCAVIGTVTDAEVADELKTSLAERGYTLPHRLRASSDPFDMLTYASHAGPAITATVEAEFSRWEQRAVVHAPATPGTAEVLRWVQDSGRSLTIVSNNSARAIETYLANADQRSLVDGVSARQPDDVGRLKPHPHLLNRAVTARATTPDRCVMIGDSPSDVKAAAAARMPAVAYANKPGKADKLAACRPRAIISHMADLLPADTPAGRMQ